ncbi:MAG: NAD(P)H-dependent oxidoreductase [Pirellulales bacterium]|nr:NAD(P)H-dependent oxidoreductase [Pirellulales bacterium]
MSNGTKILALAGSARADSHNVRLLPILAQGARSEGAEVTILNMRDYPLPVFDEDVEARGRPENASKLKQLFLDHHGLLIASPEYNSSVTPLLKNTIDWVSRPDEGEPILAAYRDKVAGIVAASPGGLGGLRGLVHLRAILSNIGVTVLPKQIAISQAFQAFDDQGNLTDQKQQQTVLGIGAAVAKVTHQLRLGAC